MKNNGIALIEMLLALAVTALLAYFFLHTKGARDTAAEKALAGQGIDLSRSLSAPAAARSRTDDFTRAAKEREQAAQQIE